MARSDEGGRDESAGRSEADEVSGSAEDRSDARSAGRRPNVLLVLGLTVGIGLVLWYVAIPYPWGLRTRNPERTSVMEQRLDEAREAGDSLEIRHEWRPLDEISPSLVGAVIVAEDHRFREHEGIDWQALAEEVEWTGDDDFSWWSPSDLAALAHALGYVWSHRDEVRGRSTLTQQVAKNLWFGTERSLVRKAMEFVVARRLERRLEKDRILELYLNVAEWGPGIFGAEAAAQAYFGRPAASLTVDQAAALAATLPHPLTSNPAHDPGRMRWRKNLILERLRPGVTPTPVPRPEVDLEIRSPDAVPRGGVDRPGVDSIARLPPETPSDRAPGPDGPDTAGAVPDTTPSLLPDTTRPAPPDTLGPVPPDTAPAPRRDTTRAAPGFIAP